MLERLETYSEVLLHSFSEVTFDCVRPFSWICEYAPNTKQYIFALATMAKCVLTQNTILGQPMRYIK